MPVAFPVNSRLLQNGEESFHQHLGCQYLPRFQMKNLRHMAQDRRQAVDLELVNFPMGHM